MDRIHWYDPHSARSPPQLSSLRTASSTVFVCVILSSKTYYVIFSGAAEVTISHVGGF